MKLRLPPFATIVRPSPEDDFVIPGAEDVGQIPPGRPPSAIQRAGGRSSAFSEAFTALMGENVRTKPSYTDCWVASVPELRPIASYMTDMGSVLIGLSEGGETVYSVTPREYAYPDPLNAVVMDVIDGIREVYRDGGGSLDRDTVMGMDLSHGGHLTHGSPVNFSGRAYNFVPYGVNRETGCIDYDELEKKARECRPALIVAGASAYSRIIDFERFRKIADEVGAKLMVDMAHIAGLVAAGLHPSPLPWADITTTTTHKTLRGPRGGMILTSRGEEYGKTINSKVFPGMQGGPLMHVIAAKAVAFGEALRPEFKEYQAQILRNARVLASCLTDAGYDLVSGGTDNHLMLLDLTRKDITGKDAEHALDLAGITVNKNTVPFETRSPFVTSGVRIGTAALTTRGMKEKDMEKVGGWIVDVLSNTTNESRLAEIRSEVESFACNFPLFAW